MQHRKSGKITKSSPSARTNRTVSECCESTGQESRSSTTYSSFLPTPVAYDATPGGPNNHYNGLGKKARHSNDLTASTYSPAASPASLFPSQESKTVGTIAATSGRKWLGALKTSGPVGSLVRTLLASSRWMTFSTKYYLTWEVSAMKYPGCTLFRLRLRERITDGNESGLWPTTTASDAHTHVNDTIRFDSLAAEVHKRRNESRLGQAADGRNPGPSASGLLIGTPKGEGARSGVRSPAFRKGRTPNPDEYAEMFLRTPTAAEATDQSCSTQIYLQNQVGAKSSKSGRLSVTFVEWLQGYPAGWTNVED